MLKNIYKTISHMILSKKDETDSIHYSTKLQKKTMKKKFETPEKF